MAEYYNEAGILLFEKQFIVILNNKYYTIK